LVLHVAGAAIAPSSTYGVRQLTVACGEGYSTPTVVVTGRWGDIDNSGGAPSALDMGFVVSKVKDAVGAFIKPRTQLREAVPNSLALVGAPDIARLQDAVKGRPYPATFAIPSCEANVLCNETPCTDAIDDCGLDGTCVDGYCRDSAGRCAQQP
jgi:hypothetical protein